MTVLTNIPETPNTNHKSFQESKDRNTFSPIEALQHILKTIMDIKDDEQVKCFYDWMSYRGYENFGEIFDAYHHILNTVQDCSNYKLNGIRCSLSENTMNRLRMFIKWMTTKSEEDDIQPHDDLLTSLTREQFINFKHEDMKRVYHTPAPSHNEPHTAMTTYTGHTKSSVLSESQNALNNFKKGTKRDASAYPIFKNDLYYDTFQRSFIAIIKPQGLNDVADPDLYKCWLGLGDETSNLLWGWVLLRSQNVHSTQM